MSFMPREMTGQPLSFMEKFMDARAAIAASPALPPSVQAFLNKDGGTKLKDTLDGSAIVVGADAEARRSGYGNPEHSSIAEAGETMRGTDGKSIKEERERRELAAIDFMRQQQELHAQLLQNVERYSRALETAQREVALAEQKLQEAQTDLKGAQEREQVASENTSQVSRETAMAIRDLEGQTIDVDGKKVRMNGSGGYVDEEGNLVSADVVAEKAEGPVADAMAQAAAMTEARMMLRRNQSNAEQAVQASEERVDIAGDDLTKKERLEAEAEQRLSEAEQRLQKFERENPDIRSDRTATHENRTPAASMTPEQYEAKRGERLEATETEGFVGGQRIEAPSLGGHFRSAALGETSEPQTPQAVQDNGMAMDPSRIPQRSGIAATIGAP